MEEGSLSVEEGGLSGHTYLPGTASLVQEIDSKFNSSVQYLLT